MDDSLWLARTEDLTKTYSDGISIPALNGVTMTVRSCEFLAIVGPSASGKTTLLNLLGTLDRPTSGRVVVDGVDVSELRGDALADFRRKTLGFVFQLFNLVPALTALENVMLPLLPYRRGLPFKLEMRASELLRSMGLEARLKHLPSQLSGGEQQRVAIARALVNDPKLVLADEPTGSLDTTTGKEIVALLRQLSRDLGVTIVAVTHDPDLSSSADRTMYLCDGKLAGES